MEAYKFDPLKVPEDLRGKDFYKIYHIEEYDPRNKNKKKDKGKSKKKKDAAKKVSDNSIKKIPTDEEEREKQLRKIRKERELEAAKRNKAKNDIIILLSKRNLYLGKLRKLNPYKRKDSEMIARINIEINEINEAIERLSEDNGIPVPELKKASPFVTFFRKVKEVAYNAKRKVCKFFKKHGEKLFELAALVVPVVAACIFSGGK